MISDFELISSSVILGWERVTVEILFFVSLGITVPFVLVLSFCQN